MDNVKRHNTFTSQGITTPDHSQDNSTGVRPFACYAPSHRSVFLLRRLLWGATTCSST